MHYVMQYTMQYVMHYAMHCVMQQVMHYVMDVTSDAQVAAAAALVQEWMALRPSRRRLLCVVNNAGVGTGTLPSSMPC